MASRRQSLPKRHARRIIANANATLPLTRHSVANSYGGFQAPDIVANLRVDQAWGSAQIMGALHDVNATYYLGTGGSPVHWRSGHPDDKLGWVIGGGIKLNASVLRRAATTSSRR